MSEQPSLPLYYQNKTQADMEAMLRKNYLRTSGWLESADTKLPLRNGAPVPWITYSALAFLERELPSRISMFEFGGGQSTLFWADRLRQVESVDSDASFVSFINAKLPENARLSLIEENSPVPESLKPFLPMMPPLKEPRRDERTFRSGQLNECFTHYALKLLEFPKNSFEVVVVDGMARNLSTWSAIQHFEKNGFIIFDNAERDFYQPAFDMLQDARYRRIDFDGLGPVNPYEWRTSVFYQPESFRGVTWFGDSSDTVNKERQAIERPSSQSEKLGILIIGFNRPLHLQSVLESLRLQGALDESHVWLDGTQGRGEYISVGNECEKIARSYSVCEVRAHHGHLGIEKLMLDALSELSGKYERLLILEDDCFPIEDAVEQFERSLSQVAEEENVYSVYGCHFGLEPESELAFPRFQGWGWAAHTRHIKPILEELKRLFLMNEHDYLAYIESEMTPEIMKRLGTTPGRDVLKVLKNGFSWDSATAFVCAARNFVHQRTERSCVINTGLATSVGHFREDRPHLRAAPFNMITLDEAWSKFDQASQPCSFEKNSYGLDELDRKILEEVEDKPGFFIELGAYDGVTQSNSVILEAAGWTGMLIEANPASFAKCVRARPNSIVEHAACVSKDFEKNVVTITDIGLMTLSNRNRLTEDERKEWIERGVGFTKRPPQKIRVPATTLSALLDKHSVTNIDLLILDVEGSEVDVLRGLDFERHAPHKIVAEDAYSEAVSNYLAKFGYQLKKTLLERKYTRDRLYVR